MNIFVSGLSSLETTLDVRGFPITYYPLDYPFFGIRAEVAGAGFRTACGSVALGDHVDFLTLVGDDYNGRRVREAITAAGMSDAYTFNMLKNTVESIVLQEKPFGRRQLYCDLKDAQDRYVDAERVEAAVKNSDICALLNVNFSRKFIPLAKRYNKPIATDVQALSDVNDAFNAEFIENADILFLSDEGIPTAPAEFMAALRRRTAAKVIVMGLGEDGVMYYDGSELKSLHSVTGGNVITAGAGAALFSGFLHYYGAYDCTDAIKRAEVYAAIKLQQNSSTGAFPTDADVEARLAVTKF